MADGNAVLRGDGSGSNGHLPGIQVAVLLDLHRNGDGHCRRRVGAQRELGMDCRIARVAFGHLSLVSADADGRLVVIGNEHSGLAVRGGGQVVAFACAAINKLKAHIAALLNDTVVIYGNGVPHRIGAGGDGHLGIAQVGSVSHIAAAFSHPHINGKRHHHCVCLHQEDGVSATLGKLGLHSADADGRQVVIDERHHGGIVRCMHCVAGAPNQGEGHRAVRFHRLVIDDSDVVLGAGVAGVNGHLLGTQGVIRDQGILARHRNTDDKIRHRHRRCRHREHSIEV